MFFTSHEYVVRVTIIFQCVLLIQLIAWEDEWFIATEILEEGKKKIKKAAKKKGKEKNYSLWVVHQFLQVGCKLRWTRL